MDRPSDVALWRAVVHTLRAHLDVPDETDRRQVERLLALAEYATSRGPDPSAARRAELRELLGRSAGAPDAARSISDVLLDGADPRRAALRAALVAHVDQELATVEVLLTGFPAPGNRVAGEHDDRVGGA